MEIEEICEKLKPLFGRKIDELYFRWRFEGEPQRKKRIEQCILALYQKHIDSILSKKKVLLPPPSYEKAKGEYELGEVIYDDKPVCGFGLREKEFLRHTGIFGITGTGKSNIVFKLIDELLRYKKNIFVFDWKRQYRDFLSIRPNADVLIFGVGNKNIPCVQFNPLIPPPGIDPSQYLEHICQIVASSYYCGEGVIALLRQAITELYEEFGVNSGEAEIFPTFKDVLEYVQNIERKGRSRDWQESTIRSLQAICSGGLSEIVNVQKPTLKLSELLSCNVFLELGELSESQKKFIIQSLLTYLYYYAMNRGEREKLLNVIIVEEAHHILRDHSKTAIKEPITDIILKEIREFSAGIIIIDQNPSLISVPALANNFTTIGLYTKHKSDISALSSAMFLSENEKDNLGKLECGYGIVKLAGRIFEPFLVKFPLINIKKGSITDSQVMEHMQKKGYSSKISDCFGWEKENNANKNNQSSSEVFPHDSEFSHLPLAKQKNISDFSQNCSGKPEKNEVSKEILTDGERQINDKIDSFPVQSGFSHLFPVDSSSSHSFPTKDEIGKMVKWFKEKWDETGGTDDEKIRVPQDYDRQKTEEMNQSVLCNRILSDIKLYPFDGMASRSKRLEISHRKCNDGILALESQGLLKRVEVKEKSCRRILFEIAGFDYSQGGIEHRYWNHAIGEINIRNGYMVEFEKKINGNGYLDQVITKDNVSTAIEIETGKSTPVETILRDLKSGFQKVICVATSQNTYNAIVRKLEQDKISTENISVVLAQNYSV